MNTPGLMIMFRLKLQSQWQEIFSFISFVFFSPINKMSATKFTDYCKIQNQALKVLTLTLCIFLTFIKGWLLCITGRRCSRKRFHCICQWDLPAFSMPHACLPTSLMWQLALGLPGTKQSSSLQQGTSPWLTGHKIILTMSDILN